MKIRTFLIILGFVIIGTGCEQPQNNSNKEISYSMDGTWVLDGDEYSSLVINNGKWTFLYGGQNGDIFNATHADNLPQYVDETVKSRFVTLSNESDTLHFEIMGQTDSILNMMYYPMGTMYLYNRQW